MKVEELLKNLYTNLPSILTADGYKNILNRNNCLIRFDVLNRMLIQMQNPDAFELRTFDEWQTIGREPNKDSKCVYLVFPKYEYKYIDIKTSKAIECYDLNTEEIIKAVKYGLIRKDETISTLYAIALYDVKDTHSIYDSKYKINKPILTTDAMMELFVKMTSAKIKHGNETKYFKTTNTIVINDMQYKDFVSAIADIIAEFCIDNLLEEAIHTASKLDIKDFSELDMKLIKSSIAYSIETLFACDSKCVFTRVDCINDISKVIEILNITDSIVYNIAAKMKYIYPDRNTDAIHSISVLRKAETIVDIATAANINNEIHGR